MQEECVVLTDQGGRITFVALYFWYSWRYEKDRADKGDLGDPFGSVLLQKSEQQGSQENASVRI